MFELTDTQKQLQASARKLAERVIQPRAAEVDRTEEYPWDNVAALTKAGFMGMTIPEEFGGGGASLVDCYLVIEELAKVDFNTALIVHDQNVSPRIIATWPVC